MFTLFHVEEANQFSRSAAAIGCGQKVCGPGLHSNHVLNLRTKHGRLTRVKGRTSVPFAALALL